MTDINNIQPQQLQEPKLLQNSQELGAQSVSSISTAVSNSNLNNQKQQPNNSQQIQSQITNSQQQSLQNPSQQYNRMNSYGSPYGMSIGNNSYQSPYSMNSYNSYNQYPGMGGMQQQNQNQNQQQQPQGFRHDYHSVISGMNSFLQMSFAGIGLVGHGKQFLMMTKDFLIYLAKKSGNLMYKIFLIDLIKKFMGWLQSGKVSGDLFQGFQEVIKSPKISKGRKILNYFLQALRVLSGIILLGFYYQQERLQNRHEILRSREELKKNQEEVEIQLINEVKEQQELEKQKKRNFYDQKKESLFQSRQTLLSVNNNQNSEIQPASQDEVHQNL